MFINKKIALISIFTVSLALQACVSAPPDVHASIPLISSQGEQEGEYLSEALQNVMKNRESGEVLSSRSKKILLGRDYVSAMGLNCKVVVITESELMNYETSMCQSEKGWFIVPDLMDKQTSEYIED